MTYVLSDIGILDKLLALNLNAGLWSALRKISQEDLGVQSCHLMIWPLSD